MGEDDVKIIRGQETLGPTLGAELASMNSTYRVVQIPVESGFTHKKLWVLGYVEKHRDCGIPESIRVTPSEQAMLEWILAQSSVKVVALRWFYNQSDDVCVSVRGKEPIRYDMEYVRYKGAKKPQSHSFDTLLTKYLKAAIEDLG